MCLLFVCIRAVNSHAHARRAPVALPALVHPPLCPAFAAACFVHTHRGSKVTSGRSMTSKGRAEMDRVARSLAATE